MMQSAQRVGRPPPYVLIYSLSPTTTALSVLHKQIQAEIVVIKKKLAEAGADASNAARQTQERSAFLAQLKKSERAWHHEALAGRCTMCDEGVPKKDLLQCTPAVNVVPCVLHDLSRQHQDTNDTLQ